ncbi:hypothetical protein IE53DRAFT_365462 [Violaceomyces palustris]|uniref:Uncharacterized protein n=1 Tax=Violaceomyces palustris TaxID=1673888 RepID=A0ACD0P8S7_9BASI|nr:hypothetical protein IE53DRAFT_365462 [Violaceomyces palustris]
MSIQSQLSAIWRPIILPKATSGATSTLQRSSQNLCLVSPTCFYLFGGELKPRTPVGDEVVKVSLKPTPSSSTLSSEVDVRAKSGSESFWPRPRVGACMTRHPDPAKRSLILWGGRGGKDMAPLPYSSSQEEEGGKEDLWVYQTETNQWDCKSTSGDKPEMRSYGTAASVRSSDGRDILYVHAGCPSKGRLGTLHSLDLSTNVWTQLPDAPGPARGGTVLAAISGSSSHPTEKLLARWGGFCGEEIGGPLDIFDPLKSSWSSHKVLIEGTLQEPPKRSVHGFVPFKSAKKFVTDKGEEKEGVAVLFMGEGQGAPAELGHDGAGKFLEDIYILLHSSDSDEYTFLKVEPSSIEGKGPEPRGWFAFDSWSDEEEGSTRIIIHGGLHETNERLSDAWLLEIKLV